VRRCLLQIYLSNCKFELILFLIVKFRSCTPLPGCTLKANRLLPLAQNVPRRAIATNPIIMTLLAKPRPLRTYSQVKIEERMLYRKGILSSCKTMSIYRVGPHHYYTNRIPKSLRSKQGRGRRGLYLSSYDPPKLGRGG
jgi:hypothetical protein